MITVRILFSFPFVASLQKHTFQVKMYRQARLVPFVFLFLVLALVPPNDTVAIKGFDLFNYKPRKSQLSNLSPQSIPLVPNEHPYVSIKICL